MVSIKKEENLGFTFGKEESILPDEKLGVVSIKPEFFTKEGSLKRELNEQIPSTKKFHPPKLRFAGEFNCGLCKEDHNPNCKYHNCRICTQRVGSHNALVCKLCEYTTHIACMKLPIVDLCPRSWVCSICSNVLAQNPTTKKPKYTGKVPGIKVGSSWSHRIQMTENRLHAPSMAGIHGISEGLAYSLVTQGGYVKDDDYGSEFFYTGAGGRDVKETHIKSQELLTTNRGLAGTCDAQLSELGATAYDWRKSAPIRVIRGHKLKKAAPIVAPAEGFRYDGLYKLFRYWKEKENENSIHCIWRFHFIRDDDEPEPWTEEGKEYIKSNNLKFEPSTIIRKHKKKEVKSSGLDFSLQFKNEEPLNPLSINFKSEPFEASSIGLQGDNAILKLSPPDFPEPNTTAQLPSVHEPSGVDILAYGNLFQFFPTIKNLIFSDKKNAIFWQSASQKKYTSELEFLHETREYFQCNICFEMIDLNFPTTTPCNHNFCLPCFRAAVLKTENCCPSCHKSLEQYIQNPPSNVTLSKSTNLSLSDVLKELDSKVKYKQIEFDFLGDS